MKRHGFTLIELMTALAISTVLLASVMGLAANLSRVTHEVRAKYPVEPWKDIIEHRLQTDYRHARSVVVRPHEIVIEGAGIPSADANLDGEHLLHRPLIVRYFLDTDDVNVRLMRTQQELGGQSSNRRVTEFMGVGITRFRVDRPLATDVAPGVLGLQLNVMDEEEPWHLILIRHGMPE